MLQIDSYTPTDRSSFRALNHEWITKYFTLEDIDNQILNNPESYILAKGGAILMARYEGQTVGTCALLKMNDTEYELGKMAVTPTMQGKKIGQQLVAAAIDKAREMGAKKLILLSHRSLVPALHVYQKMGFRQVPCTPSEYKRADIQMELDL
ncbi:MarR family transcriptional regulator [Adhaeribacter arboris]|uniref:MarR family transcriptional regulator n=1 Tax=Adhaeribacter arboris TaxID=2072846 RepID=A0A2T2YHB6_9BACT|nr:GNAT family N-acetyltransferase [Adhaeribacter arboris]PSR54905.1 MarR family transcriptional regulator [Adhaeribacter arboris]